MELATSWALALQTPSRSKAEKLASRACRRLGFDGVDLNFRGDDRAPEITEVHFTAPLEIAGQDARLAVMSVLELAGRLAQPWSVWPPKLWPDGSISCSGVTPERAQFHVAGIVRAEFDLVYMLSEELSASGRAARDSG